MSTFGLRSASRALRSIACRTLAIAAFVVAQPAGAQALPESPSFEIRRYEVAGNTVLPIDLIAATLAPYTGPTRSFADVQAAVAALRQAYARAGFGAVNVSLPEQQVADGTIHLRVTEARLRSLAIEGNTHFDAANIARSVPALREGATPNTSELAQDIRLANENPAKRIGVDLKGDASGAIDATISVQDDKPWKVGAQLDNTGTPATGRLRSGVFFQHANIAGSDQVLTGQYITSPEHPGSVTIVAANHRIPLYGLGDSIDLFGVYSDVDSGVVGDLLNLRGRGWVAGVRYNHSFPPSADYRHRLTFGFENRVLDNRVGLVGGSPDLLPDVTVHPASLGYAATWTGDRQQADVSTTAVINIPGGARGRAADVAAARSGATADYSILRWSASYVRALPRDWRLRVAGDGQYSPDSLISGEQFGIGGQDSVRGFREREVSNDRGVRASLELHTPDFGDRFGSGIAANALLFYDYGRVARNRALPGEASEVSIASVGAGMRLSIAPHYQVRADFAHVTRGTGTRPRGDESVHFSVGVAY